MAGKKLPPLSRSETEILRLLWQIESGTVQDICNQLPPSRDIAYATVQTLLRRLEAKGYLTHTARGKAHIFSPVPSRKEVISRTVGDFVEHLFGGDPAPLMLHLAEDAKLDPEQIARLERLIKKNQPPKRGKDNG